GIWRPWHELQAIGGERVRRVVDPLGADRDVLNALALVLTQIFLDLRSVVGRLIDWNSNAPARARQRSRKQSGQLALDVDKADLPKIEQLGVEGEPPVHVAALHVVREVVEIMEAPPLRSRIRFADPVEVSRVWRALRAVAIDEIDERAADAFDGGN